MGYVQAPGREEGWHRESFPAMENGEVVVVACGCALGEDHAYTSSRAAVSAEASATE